MVPPRWVAVKAAGVAGDGRGSGGSPGPSDGARVDDVDGGTGFPMLVRAQSSASAFDLGNMLGTPLCTPQNGGKIATPCRFGITPQPNPPESQDLCMNPPPNCGGL